MERFTLRTISPHYLKEFESWRFRYSRSEDENLKQSVQLMGVLSPVHVVRSSESEWFVLDGMARVQCAKNLGFSEIPVFEWNHHPDEKQGFLAGIILNSRQSWKDADKAWVIKKTSHDFSFSEKEKRMIWALMGFTQRPEPFYEDFFRLSPSCQQLADDGTIPFRAITSLLALGTQDQEELAEILKSSLTLSTNQLIQIADLFRDLLKKEKESLSGFIQKRSLADLISKNSWDKRQRAEKLLEALRRLRRPAFYQKKQALEHEIKTKKLSEKNIQVKIPDSLEGAGFSLELRFKKSEDIKPILDDLTKHEDFLKSLFDLML